MKNLWKFKPRHVCEGKGWDEMKAATDLRTLNDKEYTKARIESTQNKEQQQQKNRE